ncbi:hypothetical protein MCOR27_010110 [Pyricularia oryzae]|uniref:Elongator complex protein 4 n=1 Tax=Pyricularia grisea TaxID=148305 RepID=A0ABQ8NC14_PYRGI|nr:hypothetical protein MCOR01_008846 [Pyricularia oryzae]KAI6294628.1 hypothetical protein MCOR33_008292 [Pyricularia grisea]KAH9439518.1 hypothetical protein MCOR02_003068 [Pyricularia oryzae]KAI6255408.1 hypothetical protein MCOR19_008109 [Pyricularia oryzae]KAI6268526.1 hypothetical protein MCOR27_010110 [Pyricularia oryzae]
MSFRKRNAVISAVPSARPDGIPLRPGQQQVHQPPQAPPGLRPSPLDGRLTTSTGTASLDTLLAGHAGLPLGTSLLVEEQGTTDFSGVLLRYYAAEGLVQGHHVHALAFPEAWKYELPALSYVSKSSSGSTSSRTFASADSAGDKMKIAWRYEALGNSRSQAQPARERAGGSGSSVFCHSYDLSKRLSTSDIKGQFHSIPSVSPLSWSLEQLAEASPLRLFIKHLQNSLSSSPPNTIHRVIIPSLLSPTLYPGSACDPTEVLQFLHSLRGLLRLYNKQLTALLTLPVSLYPRASGLTRWMELLCDGVMELIPLPSVLGAGALPAVSSGSGKDKKDADKAQGIVKVYTMPVFHERGGGGSEGNHFRDNLSFSLSSSRGLVITPYSLPPMEDDDQKEKSPASTVKDGIDF